MSDLDDCLERAWWAIQMPHGTVAMVPANTPEKAYELLENTCYRHAPVREWPVLFSRFCTRADIVKRLLGRPAIGPGQSESTPEPHK